MQASSMQASDRALDAWFARISSGQVRLPRFQRFEAWGPREVTDLLQTVVDGLPSGAALVLEVGDSPPFKHRPLESAPAGPERLTELLLDGQQRLTALWRSLIDTYEDRTYFLDLSPEEENGAGEKPYRIVPQHRYRRKDGERGPLWADDPAQTLERDYVPVRLLRPGNEGEGELKGWLQEATAGDPARQLELYVLVNEFRQKIARFNLPFLRLPVGTEKPVVLDVFVKMNTRSVKLTAFDIVVAEVEAEAGESLHDRVASLNGRVPSLARYSDLSDLVLDVAALLQDRVPNQAGYLGIDWPRMIREWDLLVLGAERAVEFLEQEKVLDGDRLPSRAPLAPLIALWARAPDAPDRLGNARTLLKRYLWRSFFTDRYEKAAATGVLQDYRALLEPVRSGAKSASPPIFGLALPDADELLSTGWPRKRDRMARALLLLSFLGGALDLADGREITPGNVGKREYHHLFPVAYLRNVLAIDEGEASSALNCALVTWRTNRTIGAKDPVGYLRERAEASALGEDALRNRLASHAVPFGALTSGDYDGFRLRRAEVFEEAIATLCAGDDWAPSGLA